MHGIIFVQGSCTMHEKKQPPRETIDLYPKLTAEDKKLTGALV